MIKRHQALKDFSRDHHHALLLCWKIKMGFSKGVRVERIKAYTHWFYKNHIIDHFKIEEEVIFPILGLNHNLIVQALKEHKLIVDQFKESIEVEKSLKYIEIQLKNHIRFEEQILFNEIQKVATQDQLVKIEISHSKDKFSDNLKDPFWK